MYTSLELPVSLAERLKHTGPGSIDVLVGVAHIVAERVADLTEPATLQSLQSTMAALVADDYAEPHRVARVLFEQDLSGMLVPAAIGAVSQWFSRLQLARDGGLRVTFDTPRSGVNLIVFLQRYQEFRELERYRAVLRGLRGRPLRRQPPQ